MYRYNMYEFIDKVNDYVREEGLRLTISRYINSDEFNLVARYKGSFFSKTAYDREDFEEQVYEMINWAIDYKKQTW